MTVRFFSFVTLCILLAGCTNSLAKRSILVIGDSLGTREGWVYQFQELRGGGPLVNTALSGNTIGFDYGGSTDRNTLENLTSYLRRGYAEMGRIDEIIILLGTNDCKAEFADRHDRIAANLVELLARANAFFSERGQPAPRFVLATPPSFGPDDKVSPHFRGGRPCVADYAERLGRLAAERGYCFVDLQRDPGDGIQEFSEDGIHFSRPGYVAIAEAIRRACY